MNFTGQVKVKNINISGIFTFRRLAVTRDIGIDSKLAKLLANAEDTMRALNVYLKMKERSKLGHQIRVFFFSKSHIYRKMQVF